MTRETRYDRIYHILADGQFHGTREIMRTADVCAVSTAISQMRAKGIRLETRQTGYGRYEYRLLEAPPPGQQPDLFQPPTVQETT